MATKTKAKAATKRDASDALEPIGRALVKIGEITDGLHRVQALRALSAACSVLGMDEQAIMFSEGAIRDRLLRRLLPPDA